MPKTKALIIAKLVEWEEGGILTVVDEVALVEEEAVAELVVAKGTAVAEQEEEDNKIICSDLDD